MGLMALLGVIGKVIEHIMLYTTDTQLSTLKPGN